MLLEKRIRFMVIPNGERLYWKNKETSIAVIIFTILVKIILFVYKSTGTLVKPKIKFRIPSYSVTHEKRNQLTVCRTTGTRLNKYTPLNKYPPWTKDWNTFAAREIGVSRHNGDQIKGPRKPLNMIVLWCTGVWEGPSRIHRDLIAAVLAVLLPTRVQKRNWLCSQSYDSLATKRKISFDWTKKNLDFPVNASKLQKLIGFYLLHWSPEMLTSLGIMGGA